MHCVRGLERVTLPGRSRGSPIAKLEWVLDVAHNPAAARVWPQACAPREVAPEHRCLGMLADKDVPAVVAELRGCVDTWIAAATRAREGLDDTSSPGAHVFVDVDMQSRRYGCGSDALRTQSCPCMIPHRRLRLFSHRRSRARRARTCRPRRPARMTIIHAMDRSLKARLIGASVLVLLVVLVVPELLSGRKAATTDTADATAANGQTRTYTIELGQTAAPAATDANLPRQYTPEASPLAAERPARAQTSPPAHDETSAVRSPATSGAAREEIVRPESKPATAVPERAADGAAGAANAPPDVKSSPATTLQSPCGPVAVQVARSVSSCRHAALPAALEPEDSLLFFRVVATATLHRVRVYDPHGRSDAPVSRGTRSRLAVAIT